MSSKKAGRTSNLKQSVKITGLGLSAFEAGLQGIQALHSVIGSQVDYTTLSAVQMEAERGHPVLEAANRYFSSQVESQGQDTAELGPHVDPYGILAKLGDAQRGLHLQDNKVEYFERQRSDR